MSEERMKVVSDEEGTKKKGGKRRVETNLLETRRSGPATTCRTLDRVPI